jgi:anti-anti-sigma regulatory factor
VVTVTRKNIVIERPRDGVWVVRFARPDLFDQLYADADADVSPLYQELWRRVLARVQEGESVVLNFGLVEPFSTAFYRCLLKVREVLASRGARLVLCQLSAEHEEVFQLFKGFGIFRVVPTESRAVHESVQHRQVRRGEPGPVP